MVSDGVRMEPLPTLITAVERVITSLPYDVSTREGTASATVATLTMDLPDNLTPAMAFERSQLKGPAAFVSIPSSQDSGQYRGRDAVDSAETVIVTIAYKIRPTEQRASRNEAMRLEELVRERIMANRPPLRSYRPAYVGTSRGPAETPTLTAEWWISTQTFEFHRAASVDG